MKEPVLAGLLTDKYELTMLAAALRDGTANRRTTFELFARRLPDGRRYGVVAGTGRLLEALPQFRFGDDACELLAEFLDEDTLQYLRDYRFGGDIDGYAEGELYFPGSPVLSVTGSFAKTGTHYFDVNFTRGWSWYRSKFPAKPRFGARRSEAHHSGADPRQ